MFSSLWPSTLSSLLSVTNLTYHRLYAYNGDYDQTLHMYLHLGQGKPFELIREKNLFDAVGNKVAHYFSTQHTTMALTRYNSSALHWLLL